MPRWWEEKQGKLLTKLRANKTYSSLDLTNKHVPLDAIQTISTALLTNTKCKSLTLSSNDLGDVGAQSLARMLQQNKTLVKLELAKTGIGARGASAIAHALISNGGSAVTYLDLSGCKIGGHGAKALAEMLIKTNRIEVLLAGRNQIDTAGAASMAQALQHATTLKMLHLDNNLIDEEGATMLYEAITTNSRMQLESFSGAALGRLMSESQFAGAPGGRLTNKQALNIIRESHRSGAPGAEEARQRVRAEQLEQENRELQETVATIRPPPYWAIHTQPQLEARAAASANYVTGHMKNKMEWLLQNTIFKTHEDGCGGHEGLTNARVLRVERIENRKLWEKYAGQRNALAAKARVPSLQPQEECKVHNIVGLQDKVNEVFLFHGCAHEKLKNIFEEGLDTRLAGTGSGSLYGEGIYFAENSCKGQQYNNRDANGVYCLLYCRVALGDIYTTPKCLGHKFKRPEFDGKLYDSVVAPTGPMEGHHHDEQIHREFVVFENSQVYPEFCVYYTV
jgi:hypothetical protein